MAMLETDAARQAIQRVCELAEIKRTICIDDDYSRGPGIEEIIVLCAELKATSATSIPEFAGIPFDADADVWKAALRAKWPEILVLGQRRILRDLSASSQEQHQATGESVHRLAALMPREPQFLELTWTEWRQKRAQLLEEAKATRTLLLVDQDLSIEGGSTDEGIKIITDVLQSVLGEDIICGLLSQTFAPGEEHQKWGAFAEQNNIDRNRFMLISKQRLTGDPQGFALMLKLATLNPRCKQLRTKALEVIQASMQEAQKCMEALNIYEFAQIVFESSRKEGVWEPDTLFRLFGIFERVEARKKAKGNEELHRIADAIREISGVHTPTTAAELPHSWKIRRLEMYEDGDYLNSHHMPLDLGDIFKKPTGNKMYILLAQPCDLMVRDSGSRGKNAMTDVLFAEVVSKQGRDPTGYFQLEYFDPNNGTSRHVSFRDSHNVGIWILDLCVYQADGTALFKVGTTCPGKVIPSWRARHARITEIVTKVLQSYASLEEKLKKDCQGEHKAIVPELKRISAPRSSTENLFTGEIRPAEKVIQYNCQRVARLCQPWAGAMLLQYAHYFSRAAFEHDFGQGINREQETTSDE